LMGQGQHKIKTKAEQMACNQALQIMKNYWYLTQKKIMWFECEIIYIL
jgi:hypothetical protein